VTFSSKQAIGKVFPDSWLDNDHIVQEYVTMRQTFDNDQN
jgi:hypothetical protein